MLNISMSKWVTLSLTKNLHHFTLPKIHFIDPKQGSWLCVNWMDSTTKKSRYATDCLVGHKNKLGYTMKNWILRVSVNIQKAGRKNFWSIVVSSILNSVVKLLMIMRPLKITLMNSPRSYLMEPVALDTFTALSLYCIPRQTVTLADRKTPTDV